MSDGLSDLLSTVRIREAQWTVTTLSAGYSVSRSHGSHIGCFIVISGATSLFAGSTEIRVEKGDVAVSVSFPQVRVGAGQQSVADRTVGHSTGNVLMWERIGNSETEAVFVEGEFVLDDARLGFMRQAMPVMLVIKAFDQCTPSWIGPLGNLRSLQDILSGPGATAISSRLAEICLIQALRADAIRVGEIPIFEERHDVRIRKAVSLLNAQPEKTWTIAALASRVGMSRSEFAEDFVKAVGDSPIHYLTRVRMALACDLLKLAQLPMTEVASRTGYSSDVAFSRSFKRYFGLTPSEFRNCQSRYEADSQQVSIGSHPAFAFEV